MQKKKYLILKLLLPLIIIIGSLVVGLNIIHKNTQPEDLNLVTNDDIDSDMLTEKDDHLLDSDKNTENELNTINLVNNDTGIPVLYYHSVREPAENEVTITPEMLREELQYLKDQGYTALTLNELENYLSTNCEVPEKSILITFDDGYMDNYYNAFPILKELNMKATIFCIANELDGSYYLSEDAIKELCDYGIDIESHTVNHKHLDTLSYDEQLKELKDSKHILESITNKTVTSVAYPFGDYNDDSIKAAEDAGYEFAFTTHKGLASAKNSLLELNRIYISSEYDMNTFKDLIANTK